MIIKFNEYNSEKDMWFKVDDCIAYFDQSVKIINSFFNDSLDIGDEGSNFNINGYWCSLLIDAEYFAKQESSFKNRLKSYSIKCIIIQFKPNRLVYSNIGENDWAIDLFFFTEENFKKLNIDNIIKSNSQVPFYDPHIEIF